MSLPADLVGGGSETDDVVRGSESGQFCVCNRHFQPLIIPAELRTAEFAADDGPVSAR